MTRNNSTKLQSGGLSEATQAVRRSFVLSVAIGGLAVTGALLFFLSRQPSEKKIHTAVSDPAVQSIPETARPEKRKLADNAFTKPSEFVSRNLLASQSTNQALQLVNALTEISVHPAGFTPEKADEWKRTLEQLIQQGKIAVPVIDQFLQSNGDVRLDSIAGGNLLGDATLRIALLKVLFDIPTPDNVQLQERVLQTTTDPEEIVLLARQLELQEPGAHRELIIQAATNALQIAQNGGWPDRDVSRLAKLLTDYTTVR